MTWFIVIGWAVILSLLFFGPQQGKWGIRISFGCLVAALALTVLTFYWN